MFEKDWIHSEVPMPSNQKSFFLLIVLIFLQCASVGEKYIEAAADGDIALMEELTKKHGDLANVREERKWSALIAAASTGKLNVVQYLLQKKANLNLRTNLGDTADIVKLLLESGANPTIKDKKGDTPLMKAASKGNVEIMQLLLDAKVNPSEVRISGIDGNNALMIAAEEGQVEAMKLLIKYKADINAKNQNGDTALAIAASLGKLKAVKFLIESGANVNSISFLGITPLAHAVDGGYTDIMEELQKAGAKE